MRSLFDAFRNKRQQKKLSEDNSDKEKLYHNDGAEQEPIQNPAPAASKLQFHLPFFHRGHKYTKLKSLDSEENLDLIGAERHDDGAITPLR